jgi:hypothetical protein
MENNEIVLLLVLIIAFGISAGFIGYMLGWREGFNSSERIYQRNWRQR